MLLVLAALPALAAGCARSPTSPSVTPPFTQTDLRVGTGADAVGGRVVTVHYSGWLFDADQPAQKGVQFESSAGRTPLSFTLGAGQVIDGWDQGIVGMRAGGLRRLIIPPSLAYGRGRTGPIPPNASLLFEIELLDVQ